MILSIFQGVNLKKLIDFTFSHRLYNANILE